MLLMFLLALLLANTVNAALGDLNLLHQTADTQDSMVWPMLPNESLAQLAAKFYPNDKTMQRKFIQKTKRLNTTKLSSNTRHQKITAITIPNLKSLSIHAGSIRKANRNSGNKALSLSYNIEPKAKKSTFNLASIPRRLVKQYEDLLSRNSFLKEEIAKLNKRLVFLENKLGQLKLILDKSLTLPPKKKLKNLDEKNVATKPLQIELKKAPAASDSVEKKKQVSNFFDVSNKLLWLALAIFGLLVVLGSSLIGKYRERKYTKLVGEISQQNPETSFDVEEAETTSEADALMQTTTLSKDTIVEEHSDQSVLQEAKMLMKKGLPEEAIGHLKWSIRAKPKTSITSWLYLLEILRQQNQKDDFEKFAFEMHQHFNVMTPLWVQQSVAMVVPESLEEFPYIMKFLTDKWPNVKITNYLKKLISDNRSGERSGFSQEVVEEILLLIDVLEVRESEDSV